MNELLINFGWLSLGLILLYYGAEWLVQGASSLSLKIGLTPLIVGLTVVAFGTSAPELLVCVFANLEDPPKGGFALGNIIGSNVCNIALILGVAALVRPIKVHRQVISRDMPILLAVTFTFVWMLRDNTITMTEAIILVIVLLAYITYSIVDGLKSKDEIEIEGMNQDEIEAARNAPPAKIVFYVFLLLIGLTLLALGANRLILGGVGIATHFGVPEVLIALSLVALGTSLPELATSIVASLKKQGDIIVGNVVGSNLFNILAVIGITGIIAPLSSTEIRPLDLWFMVGLTVVALPFMWSQRRLGRLEGVILLLVYATYITLMFISN